MFPLWVLGGGYWKSSRMVEGGWGREGKSRYKTLVYNIKDQMIPAGTVWYLYCRTTTLIKVQYTMRNGRVETRRGTIVSDLTQTQNN